MGLDLEYQALPQDFSLLERARHEPEFGELLEFFRNALTEDDFGLDWDKTEIPFRRDFQLHALRIAEENSGIESRYFFGGRGWWDMLHFVLSEQRRASSTMWEPEDIMWRAIWGGDVISEKVRSTIGAPIKYTVPDETARIAHILSQEDESSVANRFHLHKMLKADVYNINQDSDLSERLNWVLEKFRGLRAFYTTTAECHEGVITVLG